LTPEQYHSYVLDAGTEHARAVIVQTVPRELAGLRDEILNDVLTLSHFNYWAYFQNVAYQKNLRFIEVFGHLKPGIGYFPDFHQATWKNHFLPHRIICRPSSSFMRMLKALINSYLMSYVPSKKEVLHDVV
jgi:hypothetical protein